MVRAILNGSKTQTRRIIKPQPVLTDEGYYVIPLQQLPCPFGGTGDRLWVKETFLNNALAGYDPVYFYRADDPEKPHDRNWKPSIFMPRNASRITLEITGVCVERLDEISEADARAEGVEVMSHGFKNYLGGDCQCGDARMSYMSLWESINGPGSWAANPFVWVIEFKSL